jgi:UDP-N-acetyl-D-galactosamine dehydrogenase
VSEQELAGARVSYTSNPEEVSKCRLIIVAVPTPIDECNIPDLSLLKNASAIVGKNMAIGSCIVFESTVYPGATEEVCVPILENESGLKPGSDFTVGYSPERINPGDNEHNLDNVVKIVSGSDDATAQFLADVYGKVVTAGIHITTSIKVAEAAKIIENTQRDLNIALMNELAMIFHKVGVDTREVLEAAGTKWNFLNFEPGIVGGHCIGVDPYYLTFKAESLGYYPEMILAGRRINNNVGKYVADNAIKMVIDAEKNISVAKIGILGLTFKEDVPDLRNTRIVDIISELNDYGIEVIVHDPLADAGEAKRYYGIDLKKNINDIRGVDAVILAVKHKFYVKQGLSEIADLCSGLPLLLDIKGVFNPDSAQKEKIKYWRL